MHDENEPATEMHLPRPAKESQVPRNRFDRMEWAGAFGDLGTLIPFLTAYVAVLKMDPLGILLAFGICLVAAGWFYRTPFPVQPMKAIGAIAVTQAAQLSMLHGAPVIAAGMLTGTFWLAAGLSGLAARLARQIPREVVQGIVLGLGLNFMLDGARMMHSDWIASGMGLVIVVILRRNRVFPSMFALLILGVTYGVMRDLSLLAELRHIAVNVRIPQWHVPSTSWNALLTGAVYLALPQIPLTLGNAIIGTTEENNRLFPDRPVTPRRVSISTGLMNLFSAGIGGVPMCHGAGGLAAHASFGARTGGASIILGLLLVVIALGFSGSIELLLRAMPTAVVGVILLMAGALLVGGNLRLSASKRHTFVAMATAGMSMWNVAAGMVVGLILFWLAKRRD